MLAEIWTGVAVSREARARQVVETLFGHKYSFLLDGAEVVDLCSVSQAPGNVGIPFDNRYVETRRIIFGHVFILLMFFSVQSTKCTNRPTDNSGIHSESR